MARSSTLKFSSFDQIVGVLTKPTTPVASFRTSTPKLADKLSAPVQVTMMTYDKDSGSIRAWGSDMKMRECKVARLHDDPEQAVRIGRALWAAVAKAGKEKAVIRFRAAGGFSADRWFYTIEA